MTHTSTTLRLLVTAGVYSFLTITTAQAVPTLNIQSGAASVNVSDQGPGDSSPMVGVVLWTGSIGVFNVNVDTGTTKPIIGSASSPSMDLSFLTNATAAGTLTITFSDDGFNYTGSLVDIIGGTAGSNSFVSDAVLKNGSPFIGQGPFSTGPYSSSSSGLVTLAPADVLGLRIAVTATGPGISSGDKDVHAPNVPDGGWSVSLLGGAMAALIALRRKLR